MKPTRTRLDRALVDRGLVASRARARALIMAGKVRLAGQRAGKAGTLVGEDDQIELLESPRFASRGGEKLDAALGATSISPRNRVCLDIGASTGGFSDCLLQAGADTVVAVDVGYGQLDWRLRQDDRVIVLERLNARYMTPADLPASLARRPSLLVVDVSFIGLGKILPAAGDLCAPTCDALVLVKPQFECGPESVGPGGIVAAATPRRRALTEVGESAEALGWQVVAAIPSPIRGATGNWECFLHLVRPRQERETASLGDIVAQIEIPDG